jgi:O-antigen ligase
MGVYAHTHASPSTPARSLAVGGRATDALLLLTVLTVSFAKLQWNVAGALSLSDVLTAVFLVAFLWGRLERGDARLTRGAGIAALFFLAFLLVYLAGFFNLETSQALAQWAKGMVKFLLHFLFLVTAIAYLARRGERFYWLTLAAFCGGIFLNACYGVVQLLAAELADANLDQALLQPLTGGASAINVYGGVEGASVYRPNALTGDPNHLGIELAAALLILTPIYLRLERGHRWRVPLALGLMFLLVVELATLSRSGLLGLGCGALVLALPYRHKWGSAAFLVPLGAVAALIAVIVAARSNFFEVVLRSRVDTGARGTSTHFAVYDFIPDVLSSNPFFGLGLNNFSVYYEFATGRTNFGPHSFYVALLVETGLVGALVFAAFVLYLFRRAGDIRRIGRRLAAAGDPLAARVRPLGWGLTAALVATLASNAFYLTMSFYYFFALALLVLAAPIVFGRRLALS